MLELRPNCELCDIDLPPESPDARICSYECTYCARCVREEPRDVCPTCGGNFAVRPIRPKRTWRDGLDLGLGFHPASSKRRRSDWHAAQIAALSALLSHIPPAER